MKKTLEYLAGLHLLLNDFPIVEIDNAIHLLSGTRMLKKNIFIIGNGGSASTASHIACDLSKNTFTVSTPGMRVFDLMSQPTVTAYANDTGYENIFINQLQNLANPLDALIAISTSGNSSNIINAVNYAMSHKMNVITMTGFNKGALKGKGHINIHIPSNCIEQVEDCHLIIGHIFTQQLKELALKETHPMP